MTTLVLNVPNIDLRSDQTAARTVVALLNTSTVPVYVKQIEAVNTEINTTGTAATRWRLEMLRLTNAKLAGFLVGASDPLPAMTGLFVYRDTELVGDTSSSIRRVSLCWDKVALANNFVLAFGGLPTWFYRHVDEDAMQPLTLRQNEALVFQTSTSNVTTDNPMSFDLNAELDADANALFSTGRMPQHVQVI
jgi:bifunctional DNase/RNase